MSAWFSYIEWFQEKPRAKGWKFLAKQMKFLLVRIDQQWPKEPQKINNFGVGHHLRWSFFHHSSDELFESAKKAPFILDALLAQAVFFSTIKASLAWTQVHLTFLAFLSVTDPSNWPRGSRVYSLFLPYAFSWSPLSSMEQLLRLIKKRFYRVSCLKTTSLSPLVHELPLLLRIRKGRVQLYSERLYKS